MELYCIELFLYIVSPSYNTGSYTWLIRLRFNTIGLRLNIIKLVNTIKVKINLVPRLSLQCAIDHYVNKCKRVRQKPDKN